jgi:hypothetical protein
MLKKDLLCGRASKVVHLLKVVKGKSKVRGLLLAGLLLMVVKHLLLLQDGRQETQCLHHQMAGHLLLKKVPTIRRPLEAKREREAKRKRGAKDKSLKASKTRDPKIRTQPQEFQSGPLKSTHEKLVMWLSSETLRLSTSRSLIWLRTK